MYKIGECTDYHDGQAHCDQVRELTGIRIRCEELGFISPKYIFLYWMDGTSKPKPKVVDAILKAQYGLSSEEVRTG